MPDAELEKYSSSQKQKFNHFCSEAGTIIPGSRERIEPNLNNGRYESRSPPPLKPEWGYSGH